MDSKPLLTRLDLPSVSVIIPMKNEEDYVAACLASVARQDYPKDLIEIIVVDGMSTDGSVHIVRKFQKKYPHIRLLQNSKRYTTYALNKAISHASGVVIARVDAHCTIYPDYIRRCVETLRDTGAQNVGGLMKPAGDSFMEKAIGFAMCSPFGVGWGQFHYCQYQTFVDTVYLGAYLKDVFDQIGFYDEEAHYSEDDELNYRLTKAGGRIVLNPQIKSEYRPRSSFKSVGRQFFNYGFGKVRSIKKHGRPASTRHVIPSAFILSIILGIALYLLIHPLYGWLTVLILVTYLLLAIIASLQIACCEGWRFFPLLSVIFLTIHVCYGAGFLYGVFHGISSAIRNRANLGKWAF